MFLKIALVFSVLLQFGAFFNTISLIRKTKFNISWISISAGFLFMAIRRLIDLLELFDSNTISNQTEFSSWIAIAISILMFIASFYIRKIFQLHSRVNDLRKEGHAKVLSAVVRTEEKERKHFSKELHDGLGPILSSIKMTLSAIDKTSMEIQNVNILEKAENNIDNAIVVVKEIASNLSPQILEDFGLEKSIKSFTNNIISKTNFEIIVDSNLKGQRFAYNIEVIVYRIVCELINNTLKHANANKIKISIVHYPLSLELIYEDNGKGFNTEEADTKGLGISNIRSRVKSLNALMEISSTLNKGMFFMMKIDLK